MADESEMAIGADRGISALLQSADAMRPLIERHAAEQESLGQLHDEVVAAFHQAGFFGIATPKALGGTELTPRETIELVSRVAYADAATGWVLFVTSGCTGIAGAFLEDEAVAQMFAGDEMPIAAGQGTRAGAAIAEGDGFRLSGDWSFGSGIKHAQWTHNGGKVDETGEIRIMVVPRSEVELIDNWDVMGLRATGSIDYSMKDVHVPAVFTHPATTVNPLRGGPNYGIGVIGIASLGHTGWAFGVARRMLDELQALVAERVGRPGGLVASDAFQIGYAEAEASLRAARALAEEVWGEVEATLAHDEVLPVRQHTLLRLALGHATWTAHSIGQFVYKWSGTTGLRAGTIQRYFRDLNAGTQHLTSSPPVLAACGRELVGAAPGQEWLFTSLVDPAG